MEDADSDADTDTNTFFDITVRHTNQNRMNRKYKV